MGYMDNLFDKSAQSKDLYTEFGDPFKTKFYSGYKL